MKDASRNSFCGRIAVSHARSFLSVAVVASATGTARPTPCGCVYLFDMPRHSLRGSLRFIPQNRISRGVLGHVARAIGMLLVGFATQGNCAEQSAGALAEAMRAARYSDGFEARMNVSVFRADGSRVTSFKLAVIGQVGESGQRLLLRGITPEKVRNRFVVAERRASGPIRAIAYTDAAGGSEKADPAAKVFDSGMVLWDMFAPWWNWGKQNLVETDTVAGRSCTVVRSQTDESAAPIREVVSCVDPGAKLSLRTQLFDRQHALVRTITVEKLVRKESGAMAAKRMTITEADDTVTEVEVYSGDEHYQVTADTFAVLEPHRGISK